MRLAIQDPRRLFGVQAGRQPPEFVRTKQADWRKELLAAMADSAAVDEIVRQMPDESTDIAQGFWAMLERFVFLGGFGEPIEDLGSTLAERMIAALPAERRPVLLNQLNDRRASFFFSGGRWLRAETMTANFPVEFVADWFSARFVAYGQDMVVADLWRLLQDLAEEKPEYAFGLALVPAFATTEDGRKFQIELLGSLRFRPGLPKTVADALPAVLAHMQSSPSPAERANYLRSLQPGHRATEFRQRCLGLGIKGVTLHSYRYAWTERAKIVGHPERFAQLPWVTTTGPSTGLTPGMPKSPCRRWRTTKGRRPLRQSSPCHCHPSPAAESPCSQPEERLRTPCPARARLELQSRSHARSVLSLKVSN